LASNPIRTRYLLKNDANITIFFWSTTSKIVKQEQGLTLYSINQTNESYVKRNIQIFYRRRSTSRRAMFIFIVGFLKANLGKQGEGVLAGSTHEK
jgi:hypothetical protein